MDENAFKERVQRLEAVNAVIAQLDPAIRAEAFALLKSYITGVNGERENGELGTLTEVTGAENFFSEHSGKKAADNAVLAAGYLYSQYGTAPFSIDELRELAESTGLTIPARSDVTIAGATRKGKRLFQRTDKGTFKPTVHGETYFKNTLNIAKGKKKKVEANE